MEGDLSDVAAHVAALQPDYRREEAMRLDALFRDTTGFQPKLWSGRMIGYGEYAYTYKSGHSGRWLATGFAAPARHLTVYIMPGYTPFPDIMARLGPHKVGRSCLYITRLDRIDEAVLAELIQAGLEDLATRWTIEPT